MQFKPDLAEKSVKGEKTMTRREAKPWEWLSVLPNGSKAVFHRGRVKWEVGKTYAIQPGRGVAAIGRFTLLDIRRERVQDISEADAKAEGVEPLRVFATGELLYKPAFAYLWNEINGDGAGAFGDNPEVWVLVFEVV